jgi:glycosyltransferase involved in cell wall biosynthesis
MSVPHVPLGSKRPQIAVAQLGARRHYAIPAMLQQARLLSGFYTDTCAHAAWVKLARRLIPPPLRPNGLKRLLARHVNGVPEDKIHCHSLLGVGRILRRDRGTTHGQVVRAQTRSNERFCRSLAARGFGNADTVYAFNGAALELFESAKRRGMRTILEQTAAPWAYDEKLLAEERKLWPGWESGGVELEDWRPMSDREIAEWSSSDLILCGSQYVVDAMREQSGPVHRCAVVPYGIDSSKIRSSPRERRAGPLRVLCVGTVQLRKGVQYLMQAARSLKGLGVEFHVVGPIGLSQSAISELRQWLTLVGSVPRSEMLRHYEAADLFVLPTLSEGSANVCYEALAAGLPVITTANAGSVVRDGHEGYLIPIRNPDAIAERIIQLRNDPDRRASMSVSAMGRARDYTWERYAERLLGAVLGQTLQNAGPAGGR